VSPWWKRSSTGGYSLTMCIGGKLVTFDQAGHNAITVPGTRAEAMKAIESILRTLDSAVREGQFDHCFESKGKAAKEGSRPGPSRSMMAGGMSAGLALIERFKPDDSGAVVVAGPERDRRGGVVHENFADIARPREQIFHRMPTFRIKA
jgi:hypothetical protein